MKQSMFIALFLITMNVIHGQTVNGVPMDSIKTDYVEIVGTEKFLSTKMNVDVYKRQD